MAMGVSCGRQGTVVGGLGCLEGDGDDKGVWMCRSGSEAPAAVRLDAMGVVGGLLVVTRL